MENNLNYSANEVLDVALEIGMNLLRSGAEIRRVEATISYISKAYGAESVEVFAIPTLIIATVNFEGASYTSKIKRNDAVNTDLYRLGKYNSLSRYIVKNKPPLAEVIEKIYQEKILTKKTKKI